MMKKVLSYIWASLLILSSCADGTLDDEHLHQTSVQLDICATKASVVQDATYRACLFSGNRLVAQGTYCGYQNPKGWLYPCRTDDLGNALNSSGNQVTLQGGQWDKDSKWALHAQSGTVVYSLVFLSPALKTDIVDDYASLYIDRSSCNWKASDAVNLQVSGVSMNDSYIYDLYDSQDPDKSCIINERRSKVTVKVACGKAESTDIVSVQFNNVISSAKYLPHNSEYSSPVLDGGNADTYYTVNSYPSEVGNSAGVGEKFVAPEGSPAHIVKKPLIGTVEKEWFKNFSSSDEWLRGYSDKYMLTAIKDFYILSLDYSREEGGELYYKGIIPEIIVTEKLGGANKKITLQLAADIKPMKDYTVYLFISNIDVQATLTASDWEDVGNQEVMFGQGLVTDGKITIASWEEVDEDITIVDNGVYTMPIDGWDVNGKVIEF